MRFAALFVAIAALATSADASPTRTRDEVEGGRMRARSVPSPGGACYFSCPSSVDGFTFVSKTQETGYFGDVTYRCSYQEGYYCEYNADGSRYDYDNSACPLQAPDAGCSTSNPNPDTDFRKRKLPRNMTPLEQRLSARQYKPKKVVKR